MIPGPVMCNSSVLKEMSKPVMSHGSSEFIEIFGDSLRKLKQVFMIENGEVFVVAGSGTLAMEMALVNVCEPGDEVLILSNGMFGERFKEICLRHRLKVDYQEVKKFGDCISTEVAKNKLEEKEYKAVTVTHVDTSTSVKAPVKEFGRIIKKTNAVFIVDGVCATGGEEERMESWGIDVLLTASQKAISVPPGLALVAFSRKAVEIHQERRNPVDSYFLDIQNWRNVMNSYINRKVFYFATPPINLIYALKTSLTEILKEGLEKRFRRHALIAKAFREAIKAVGLEIVPLKEDYAANTVTAVYYPVEVEDNAFRYGMLKEGVVVAGGLGPLKKKTFRVGHMGNVNSSDIIATISAVERVLFKNGYKVTLGQGLEAAQEVLNKL